MKAHAWLRGIGLVALLVISTVSSLGAFSGVLPAGVAFGAAQTGPPAASPPNGSTPEAKDQTKEAKAATDIEFSDPEMEKQKQEQQAESDVFYAPPIETFFQNSAFQANLASGVDALNQSVDTLMDSLFYSIVTNETNVYANPFVWFNLSLRRSLYTTPTGYFVIVDRFRMGPRYNRVLWTLHHIPISLGVDASAEAMQIYLRTDGMRLAQEREMGTFRRLANNWFGLVPLLTDILPPSFNQNHLYDPITEVETPFVFPLSVDTFYTMPIASIRSYALSGGVALSPDIGGLVPQSTLNQLMKAGGIAEGMPYSLFKRGEFRINVLRRSEHSAWVGVSDLDRRGQGIYPLVGQRFYILHGALGADLLKYSWRWNGLPVNMFPVTMNIEQALVNLFEQVYEYDLRIPAAQEAYEAAVKGNFVPSHDRYLDAKEKGLETGVIFHFARHQDRHEVVSTNGPNVAVYKRERQRTLDNAEVEVTDQAGKFYVLESTLNVEDKKWNILVGEDNIRTQQVVEMKVNRVVPKGAKDPEKDFTYAFVLGPDPYRLSMTLALQDKYTDTDALGRHLEDLRLYTALPMDNLPVFAERDAEREALWRRQGFFMSPKEQVTNIHVTPSYLGRFGAQAAVSFPMKELLRIINTDENQMWAAFAQAYGYDEKMWSDPAQRHGFGWYSRWLPAVFTYPLRLASIRIPAADAVRETQHAVAALIALRTLEEPLDKLEGFRNLLDTDYPRELARALLNMSDLQQVSRTMTLSAQPQGSGNANNKASYGLLNNKKFRSGPAFPPTDRYDTAKATLAKFYLNHPEEASNRPHIEKIQVTTRPIPDSVRRLAESAENANDVKNLNKDKKHVFVDFSVDGVQHEGSLKVYVRIDESGKLQIGKLSLAENVIELQPIDGTKNSRVKKQTFEFYLTGPLSPLSNETLDSAVAGGDQFLVTMSVSSDGVIWSNERTFEFNYQDGNLYPVK